MASFHHYTTAIDMDALFKVPKLPSRPNKRKMPDNPSPDFLKKIKMDVDSSPSSSAADKGKGRAVTIEEVPDEDTFAPGNDADYFQEEDDEGRFFGGGLSGEQKEILNIFGKAEGDDGEQEVCTIANALSRANFGQQSEVLSLAAVRRMLTRFERAADENQGQRSKYPDDPTK